MASLVGNPTGATSAERLTGGAQAPSGYRGGVGRAAQENVQRKGQIESVRQQAVAKAASARNSNAGRGRFGPEPGRYGGKNTLMGQTNRQEQEERREAQKAARGEARQDIREARNL